MVSSFFMFNNLIYLVVVILFIRLIVDVFFKIVIYDGWFGFWCWSWSWFKIFVFDELDIIYGDV